MKAIFKRELKSYFNSPLVYVVMSVYLLYSLVMFFINNVFYYNPELLQLFMSSNLLMHLVIPFITMRLFSEEKSQKTDQLLLTSPNSVTSVVMGKYLSAVVIVSMMVATTVVYAFIIDIFTTFDWPMYFMLLLGALLMNLGLVSVGLLVSAVFGNVMISALVTLGATLLIYFSGMITMMFAPGSFFGKIFGLINLTSGFDDFALGLLSIEGIIYYLSFAALFVFLAVRVIDKRRWE